MQQLIHPYAVSSFLSNGTSEMKICYCDHGHGTFGRHTKYLHLAKILISNLKSRKMTCF